MATKKTTENPSELTETVISPATKVVRNRGSYKVELNVNGTAVVVLPGKSVTVPYDLDIPVGINLYMK